MGSTEIGDQADQQRHSVGKVETFRAYGDYRIETGNGAEVYTAECHLDDCSESDCNDWHLVLRLDLSNYRGEWQSLVTSESIERSSPFSEQTIGGTNINDNHQRCQETGSDVAISRVEVYLKEWGHCWCRGNLVDISNAEAYCNQKYESSDGAEVNG